VSHYIIIFAVTNSSSRRGHGGVNRSKLSVQTKNRQVWGILHVSHPTTKTPI
jgi:hypothetical protein